MEMCFVRYEKKTYYHLRFAPTTDLYGKTFLNKIYLNNVVQCH